MLISISPANVPIPAPKSHHVVILEINWSDCFVSLFEIEINGEKVVPTALNKKVIIIPTVKYPNAMMVSPIILKIIEILKM